MSEYKVTKGDGFFNVEKDGAPVQLIIWYRNRWTRNLALSLLADMYQDHTELWKYLQLRTGPEPKSWVGHCFFAEVLEFFYSSDEFALPDVHSRLLLEQFLEQSRAGYYWDWELEVPA